MPLPAVFVGHVDGDTLPAADWDNNWILTETSLMDVGPYVVSGMVPTIGTGLSVNVSSGHAAIGPDVTFASFSITALTDNILNHLYALQNGTGASNTTGTAPANSVKLGTATTAAGVVSSVNTNRSSGRQLFQQPQNLVLGGPGAGNPRTLNLASWNASAGDGFECSGTLPAAAVGSGSLTAPVTITRAAVTATNPPPLLTVTGAADTALTASTEANALLLDFSATRQWATGALTTQRAMWVRSPTYGFVGASTLTNAATLAIEGAPAAGANATITNPMALWVQGGNTVLAGNLGVGAGSNNPGFTLSVNAGTRNAPTQGVLLAVVCSPDTNRSAGIEYFDFAVSAAPTSIQWATGAITRQRFSWFRQNTVAFVGASTVSDAATLAIEGAPLAGTNATLTRSMALWVQAGQSRFDGDLFHKGTNLGFYNVGPVARPAAYTLAGSATRTFPTDPSAAYSGIATGVGGTPYAQVADVNTLRGVVSSLEGVVRQVVADLQANGLLQ